MQHSEIVLAELPKISFVVLTYNRVDALLRVIEALAQQCHSDHEIIIADDGSCAQAVEALRRGLPTTRCRIRHVWHPDVGFTASRARNLGALCSSGNYLVFLDGDCIPNLKFVCAHEALADERCFVNGSRVLLSERLTERVISQDVNLYQAKLTDWFRWRLQGSVNKLAHLMFWPQAPFRVRQKFYWKQIRSCNFAVWKNDFVRVNGFDETFEGWGHEDADLVLRLHNLGLQRINGYWGTEVYHLWHRQNSRDHENVNYQRVLSRIQSGLVRASKGLHENSNATDVVVSQLN